MEEVVDVEEKFEGLDEDNETSEDENERIDNIFLDNEGKVYLDLRKIDWVADIIRPELEDQMHREASLHTSYKYFIHRVKAYLFTFVDAVSGRLYLCQIIVLLAFINGYTVIALIVFLIVDTMLVFCCVHYFFCDFSVTFLKNVCCWCVVDRILGSKSMDEGKSSLGVWIYRYRTYYESVFEYSLEAEHNYETWMYKGCKMFSALLILITSLSLHYSFYNPPGDVVCNLSQEIESPYFLWYNNQTTSFEQDFSNPFTNNDEDGDNYRYYTLEPKNYTLILFVAKLYSYRFFWDDDVNLSQCKFITYDFFDRYKTLVLGIFQILILIFFTIRNYNGPGAKQYSRQLQKLRDCNVRFPKIHVTWGDLTTVKTGKIFQEVLTILYILKNQIHMKPGKDPVSGMRECPAYEHLEMGFRSLKYISPMELGFLHYFFIDALEDEEIAVRYENDYKKLLEGVCKLACKLLGKLHFRMDVAGLEWNLSLFQGDDDEVGEILEKYEKVRLFTLKNVARNIRVGCFHLSCCLMCCCFFCSYPSHLFDSCVYLDKKIVLRQFRSRRSDLFFQKDDEEEEDDDEEEEEEEGQTQKDKETYYKKEWVKEEKRMVNEYWRISFIEPWKKFDCSKECCFGCLYLIVLRWIRYFLYMMKIIFDQYFSRFGSGEKYEKQKNYVLSGKGTKKRNISEGNLNSKALFVKLVSDLAFDCMKQFGNVFQTSTAKLFCKITFCFWSALIVMMCVIEILFILATFFHTHALVEYEDQLSLSPLEFLGPRNTTELNFDNPLYFRSESPVKFSNIQLFSFIPLYGVYNWSKYVVVARLGVYAVCGVFAFLISLYCLTVLIVFSDELEKHWRSFSFERLYRRVYQRRRIYETAGLKNTVVLCGNVCCISCKIGKYITGKFIKDAVQQAGEDLDQMNITDNKDSHEFIENKISAFFDDEEEEKKRRKRKTRTRYLKYDGNQDDDDDDDDEEEEEIDVGSYDSLYNLLKSYLTRIDFYCFDSFVLVIVATIFFLFFVSFVIVAAPITIIVYGVFVHFVYLFIFFFIFWCSCISCCSLYIWCNGFCCYCSLCKVLTFDDEMRKFNFRRRNEFLISVQSDDDTTLEKADDAHKNDDDEGEGEEEEEEEEEGGEEGSDKNLTDEESEEEPSSSMSSSTASDKQDSETEDSSEDTASAEDKLMDDEEDKKKKKMFKRSWIRLDIITSTFCGSQNMEEIMRCGKGILGLVVGCCGLFIAVLLGFSFLGFTFLCATCIVSFIFLCFMRLCFKRVVNPCLWVMNEHIFSSKFFRCFKEKKGVWFEIYRLMVNYINLEDDEFKNLESEDDDKEEEEAEEKEDGKKVNYNPKKNEVIPKLDDRTIEKIAFLVALRKLKCKERGNDSVLKILKSKEEKEKVREDDDKTETNDNEEENVAEEEEEQEQEEEEEDEEEEIVSSSSSSDEQKSEEALQVMINEEDEEEKEDQLSELEEGGGEKNSELNIFDHENLAKNLEAVYRLSKLPQKTRRMIHSSYERDVYTHALSGAKEVAEVIGTDVVNHIPVRNHNGDIRRIREAVKRLVRKSEKEVEARRWEKDYKSGWEFCRFVLRIKKYGNAKDMEKMSSLPRGRYEKIMNSPKMWLMLGKDLWNLMTSKRNARKRSDEVLKGHYPNLKNGEDDLYRQTSGLFSVLKLQDINPDIEEVEKAFLTEEEKEKRQSLRGGGGGSLDNGDVNSGSEGGKWNDDQDVVVDSPIGTSDGTNSDEVPIDDVSD